MNHCKKLSFIIASSLFLLGCSSQPFTLQSLIDEEKTNHKNQTKTEPNQAIKQGVGAKILPSNTYQAYNKSNGQGHMQKSLDQWTKEEWEPAFEGDEEQAKKDANASENFKLQHYYDKSYKYFNIKEEERIKSGKVQEPSNYEKMKKMPVIGEQP